MKLTKLTLSVPRNLTNVSRASGSFFNSIKVYRGDSAKKFGLKFLSQVFTRWRFYLPVNGYEISHKIAGTAVKEKYQPQRSALPIILGSAIICPTEKFALKFFKGEFTVILILVTGFDVSDFFHVGDKWPILGISIVSRHRHQRRHYDHIKMIPYLPRIPMVIMSWLRTPIQPRSFFEANSIIYMGHTPVANPENIPKRILATVKHAFKRILVIFELFQKILQATFEQN